MKLIGSLFLAMAAFSIPTQASYTPPEFSCTVSLDRASWYDSGDRDDYFSNKNVELYKRDDLGSYKIEHSIDNSNRGTSEDVRIMWSTHRHEIQREVFEINANESFIIDWGLDPSKIETSTDDVSDFRANRFEGVGYFTSRPNEKLACDRN